MPAHDGPAFTPVDVFLAELHLFTTLRVTARGSRTRMTCRDLARRASLSGSKSDTAKSGAVLVAGRD